MNLGSYACEVDALQQLGPASVWPMSITDARSKAFSIWQLLLTACKSQIKTERSALPRWLLTYWNRVLIKIMHCLIHFNIFLLKLCFWFPQLQLCSILCSAASHSSLTLGRIVPDNPFLLNSILLWEGEFQWSVSKVQGDLDTHSGMFAWLNVLSWANPLCEDCQFS